MKVFERNGFTNKSKPRYHAILLETVSTRFWAQPAYDVNLTKL